MDGKKEPPDQLDKVAEGNVPLAEGAVGGIVQDADAFPGMVQEILSQSALRPPTPTSQFLEQECVSPSAGEELFEQNFPARETAPKRGPTSIEERMEKRMDVSCSLQPSYCYTPNLHLRWIFHVQGNHHIGILPICT